MFRKVIVFGLFEMIQKKNSEDRILGSGFDLQVGSNAAVWHTLNDFCSLDSENLNQN